MKTPSVFLSYAADDEAFATSFAQELQRVGVTVLGRLDTLSAGDAWLSQLRAAIERSDGLVLIAPEGGHAGANSAFFEAGAARSLGKFVFAVVPHNDRSRLDDLPSSMISLAVFNPAERPGLSADVIARELRASMAQAA